MGRSHSLTEGNILTSLMDFMLPMLAVLLLQTMHGAIDMMIAEQFSHVAGVSTASTGSWIMQTITTAIVGLAMGTATLLGRKIGEGQPEETDRVIGVSIWIFAVIGLAVTAVTQFLAVPCTAWMWAPKEAFDSAAVYVKICSVGSLFIVAYNLPGSIFRGLGNPRLPLIFVSTVCLVNIAGDLLLTGVFHMAFAGATAAMIFARTASVVLSILIIRKQKLPFAFRKESVHYDRQLVDRVVKPGFPITFQDVLVPISFLVISAIINTLRVTPSADVGVAEKLYGFILLVPSIYGQAMSVFTAQDIGARRPERAERVLAYGILTSLGVDMFLAYLSFFHGGLLVGVFSRDRKAVLVAVNYLRAYTIDCLLMSFMLYMTGFFNGCGRTAFITFQGTAGTFGVCVPMSYLMSRLVSVSLFRIGLAVPASTLLQILLCDIYLEVLNQDPLLHGTGESTNRPRQTI